MGERLEMGLGFEELRMMRLDSIRSKILKVGIKEVRKAFFYKQYSRFTIQYIGSNPIKFPHSSTRISKSTSTTY